MKCAVKGCRILDKETDFINFPRKKRKYDEFKLACGYSSNEDVPVKVLCKGHFQENDLKFNYILKGSELVKKDGYKIKEGNQFFV